MHLIGAVLGGFLAGFQFIPVIRYKFLLFHRLNGYAAIILMIVGNAGAFMIMDVAVGGSPSLQLWIGIFGAMITLGLALAVWNIKRLQIDQHRAWMLRVWTWAGSIATLRLMLMAGRHVCSAYGYTFFTPLKCSEIYFMYAQYGVPDEGNPTGQLYPACALVHDRAGIPTGQTINPAINSGTWVSVSSVGEGPENVASEIHQLFPMAGWLAIFLHVLAVEVYLWLTPAESYRLRNVSYEKQVEKGLRARGSYKDAGLTGTRIGDVPDWWSIPAEEFEQQRLSKTEREIHQKESIPLRARLGSESESAGTMVSTT